MPTVVNWREAQPVVSHESAIVWNCLQSEPGDGSGAVDLLSKTTCRLTHTEKTWLTHLIIAAR